VGPVEPFEPAGPVGPVGPVLPCAPCEPVDPVGPVGPCKEAFVIVAFFQVAEVPSYTGIISEPDKLVSVDNPVNALGKAVDVTSALVATPSSFVPSVARFLPSTFPLTVTLPVTVIPLECATILVTPSCCTLPKSSDNAVIKTFAVPPNEIALPPPLLSVGVLVKVVPLEE
jgi:hypothetical protein